MSDSRHDQLIAAGWRYDPATDRYAAPNSPTDGTARQYNLAAAWASEQARQADAKQQPAPADTPPARRQADPRKQEPQ